MVFIEENNNFIKVLKRIAFGFKSFRRFKARIMICKGLVKINKKKANTFTLAHETNYHLFCVYTHYLTINR